MNATAVLRCPDCAAGEQLTTGWEAVLKLLDLVPRGEEPTTIALAFQSTQLVLSDCMPSLPANLLFNALEVSALYAAQQVRLAMC